MNEHDTHTTEAPGWAADLLNQLDELTVAEPTPPTTASALPPILTSGQRQGDVFVQPDPGMAAADRRAVRRRDRGATLLADGQEVVIVPEGNRHVLIARTSAGGRVRVWRQAFANVVLTMHIEAPAFVLLVQPSGPNPHAPLGVGPGWYAVCRQVEPQIVVGPPRALAGPSPATDFRSHHASLFVVD